MSNSIVNYIKKNSKTKEGRRLLIIEGVMLAIGIAVLIIVTPKEITISGHVGLLILAYMLWSVYYFVIKTTHKRLSSNESKE